MHLIELSKRWYAASYRRRAIDRVHKSFKNIYRGRVLDIGGRDRGSFVKPRTAVDEWIFADIEPSHNPDRVLDVADMSSINRGSFDIVSAIELFEHVEQIEAGLRECFRVLRPGGVLIISVPFLYQIHGDPNDYQRWTEAKWRVQLAELGFHIDQFEVTGWFFTVAGDMARDLLKSWPKPIQVLLLPLFMVFDFLVMFDELTAVRRSPRLRGYHGGYFIIATK